MANKKSLGRGFDILMPTNLDASIIEEDQNRVQRLSINDVLPNPDQPRRKFDEAALGELTASVKRHGVIQPIIVVRHGNQYRIVAGERRWRAASEANLTHIPAVVRSLEELEQIELSLIENIQREDLSPLEQALSIYRLQQQFNLALEQIAAKLGKAPSTVSNIARLLQLPETAKQALLDQKISEGHARAILALKDNPVQQQTLLEEIIKHNWTVRQAEQYVVAHKKGQQAKAATLAETPLTEKLSQSLKTPVRLRRTAKGGQILISYKNDADLERIAKRLSK